MTNPTAQGLIYRNTEKSADGLCIWYMINQSETTCVYVFIWYPSDSTLPNNKAKLISWYTIHDLHTTLALHDNQQSFIIAWYSEISVRHGEVLFTWEQGTTFCKFISHVGFIFVIPVLYRMSQVIGQCLYDVRALLFVWNDNVTYHQ